MTDERVLAEAQPLTAAELDEYRAEHQANDRGVCPLHGVWPCATARWIATLDAAGYVIVPKDRPLRDLGTARSNAAKAGVVLRHTETLDEVARRIVDDPRPIRDASIPRGWQEDLRAALSDGGES